MRYDVLNNASTQKIWYNNIMFAFIVKCYRNFRLWGWKGVFRYVPQQIEKWRVRQKISRFVRSSGDSPRRGITLIGGFSDRTSLSKVFRDFAYRLKEADIPFQAYDPTPAREIPEEDYTDIITPDKDFDLYKYDHVIDNIAGLFVLPLPKAIKHGSITFWEFDSGIIEGYPHILQTPNVIAMSDFNYDYFRKALPQSIGVYKILYPFRFNPGELDDTTTVRRRYDIGENDFVVFFNFALGTARKNPEGVIKAFAIAFKGNSSAKLVFKVVGAKKHSDELERINKLVSKECLSDNVKIVTQYLPMKELYDLTNACDVYISLHRGEGFGLGVAEAMSLGKTVVVTDYSSTKEFCNSLNSFPIPFKLTRFSASQPHLPYRGVKEWAEPDIQSAASALSRIFQDSSLRHQIAQRAQNDILSHFSTEKFRESINAFLKG